MVCSYPHLESYWSCNQVYEDLWCMDNIDFTLSLNPTRCYHPSYLTHISSTFIVCSWFRYSESFCMLLLLFCKNLGWFLPSSAHHHLLCWRIITQPTQTASLAQCHIPAMDTQYLFLDFWVSLKYKTPKKSLLYS